MLARITPTMVTRMPGLHDILAILPPVCGRIDLVDE